MSINSFPVFRWLATFCAISLLSVGINVEATSAQKPLNFNISFVGTDAGNGRSVAWGDMDGDGDLDLAVGNAYEPNQIYMNNGDGTFELTWQSPVADTVKVAWGDMDGDGDLDLAVANVPACLEWEEVPGTVPELPESKCVKEVNEDQLYRNDGATDRNGKIDFVVFPLANSLNTSSTDLAWGDADGDGDLDLAISNEGFQEDEQNHLYLNDGVGNFSLSVQDIGVNGRTLAWGDVDGDLDLDLAVGYVQGTDEWTPLASVIQIYQNSGTGEFTKGWEFRHQFPMGTDTYPVGWGIQDLVWADMEGDGDLDLATGLTRDNNQIFQNDGAGNLSLVWESASATTIPERDTSLTEALAWGDLDNDGDLDLVVANGGSWALGGSNQIYRHESDPLNSTATEFTVLDIPGTDETGTYAVSWGDMDNDGDLDLAFGNAHSFGEINLVVYRNDSNTFLSRPPYLFSIGGFANGWSRSLAWGDVDNDGDYDLAIGNDLAENAVFRNENGRLSETPIWNANGFGATGEVIWGDVNGDGYLDLAFANGGPSLIAAPNQIYLNRNGTLDSEPAWNSEEHNSHGLAWGDVDNDGDLDLAVDNEFSPNLLYLNQGQILSSTASWRATDDTGDRGGIAWGDVDNDGDLDLAVGNDRNPNQLYLNDGGRLATVAAWHSLDDDSTESVAWGDVNADGFIDLAVGNVDSQNKVYLNRNGHLEETASWTSGDLGSTYGVHWVDVNSDGDLDLFFENWFSAGHDSKAYLNQSGNLDRFAVDNVIQTLDSARRNINSASNNAPFPMIVHPAIPPQILDDSEIGFTYYLFDAESDFVGHIEGYYSLNGGGQWFLATPTADTQTAHLATSPYPAKTLTNSHQFVWNVAADGVFGLYDSVVFRLVTYSRPVTTGTGSSEAYRYVNGTAGSFQTAKESDTTAPFRLRSTQVRVVDASGVGISEAVVYRLPAGASTGAMPFSNIDETTLRTDSQGYLQGRGELKISSELEEADQLVALWPISSTSTITFTDKIRSFQTSAAVTDSGLAMRRADQKGIISLTVLPNNKLTLFDLIVSLDWDARNDGTFLANLENGFKRASEVLFDVSDGQIALGDVKVYQAKEKWTSADVVIYANSSLRPRASMGGVVNTAIDEVNGLKGRLPNAYLPGQIRIGPNWDPFGQNKAELTQDWWRALAHELAHYLLFLPDNYVGLDSANKVLKTVDCKGSFMTDAYNPSYSEFLNRGDSWNRFCQQTVAAALLTGRSDWETVTTFYPQFASPRAPLEGPSILPIAVTQVSIISPTHMASILPVPARNFDLRKRGSIVSPRQAQGFLLKKDNADVASIVALGTTGAGSDRMMVRGAHVGDEVCVFDMASSPAAIGCETIQAASTSIDLTDVPDWQPRVIVSAVTTRTFNITVTNAADLRTLQLVSAYGPPKSPTAVSSCIINLAKEASERPACLIALNQQRESGVVAARLTLAADTAEGFVYLVGSGASQRAITQFFVSDSWGPNMTWDDANRVMGANHRSFEAPAASGDGKMTLFNVDDILDQTGVTSIQTISSWSDLPLWLTPVGQGYRISVGNTKPITRSLLFQYLSSDVPDGSEHTLHIYFQPANTQTWQRLPTGPAAGGVDLKDNLASTRFRGPGTYALMATVEMPPLQFGWNPLGYPIGASQPVTHALSSLDGLYTSVYAYQPGQPLPWRLFDSTVKEPYRQLVNTLDQLDFGHNYAIYITATETITPYIGVAPPATDDEVVQSASTAGLVQPPSTYYGPVIDHLAYSDGDTITASINGQNCGTSRLRIVNNELVYTVQAASREQINGCGATGVEVILSVGNEMIAAPQRWDNRRAWFTGLSGSNTPTSLDLVEEPNGPQSETKTYLPLVTY